MGFWDRGSPDRGRADDRGRAPVGPLRLAADDLLSCYAYADYAGITWSIQEF